LKNVVDISSRHQRLSLIPHQQELTISSNALFSLVCEQEAERPHPDRKFVDLTIPALPQR
jgi:hypothetical protein